ncbi:response regulator [Flavonifractor sp. DFI.6.63]|jgi:two component transcriptional regulator, araC family|uniref:Stage 0 sporulation protein A homolog n=1 Tax=Lawsonibacter hominis TaxID=2763053 RepID=A0A8J6J7U5_9FIRM|nr:MULTISPECIES: response regulator [Oscillospiraceae]MBC5735313.1 response regulator [Lawsonibacter hominis]MCQ5029967.1 response regulator [Flavonifractor sp. DFI.6.63]MDU2195833.1 response regulator [Clostridiales bacterium]MDY2977092.1 response regulator [Oscillospiraceae bacterium]
MLTALIVEDESLMREYLMMNLNNIHNQWVAAACARDGIEATALLNEQHFDLVITDIKMPRMGGLELATHISSNIPNTDIILLTGYDEFNFARTAIRIGVADYLLKPLRDGELHSILDRLASKRNNSDMNGDLTKNITLQSQAAVKSDVVAGNPNILIQRVRNYIERHYCEQISLSEVADLMDVNPTYLSSIFESEQGESYSKYVLRLRIERAALLLRTHPVGNISDIATDVGYLSAKHFISVFKKYYGMTPSEFRSRFAASGTIEPNSKNQKPCC